MTSNRLPVPRQFLQSLPFRQHLATMSASSSSTHPSTATSHPSIPTIYDPHGIAWYSLSVPPAELRLDITLWNGQAFGWERLDAVEGNQQTKRKESDSVKSNVATKSNKRKRVKLENDVEDNQTTLPYTASASAAVPNVTAAAAVEPLLSDLDAATATPAHPFSVDDPHYVGVLGNSVIGLRQTATDVFYTEHAPGDTDLCTLDERIRDYFHLPSRSPGKDGKRKHEEKVLEELYKRWVDGHESHHLHSSTSASAPTSKSKLQASSSDSKSATKFKLLSSAFPGVRLLRQDPLEALFSFICSSNNNIARITLMLRRLRESFGVKIEVPKKIIEAYPVLSNKSFYSFPTLEALCTIKEEELRKMGFGYRAKYIVQSASTLHSLGGVSFLHSLRGRSRAEVEEALLSFAGVGPKVSSCIALFSLDCLESIPVDTHVFQIARRDYAQHFEGGTLLNKAKSVTSKIYEGVGEIFRKLYQPYAGWAHCILFLAELPEYKRRIAMATSSSSSSSTSSKQISQHTTVQSNTETETVDTAGSDIHVKVEEQSTTNMDVDVDAIKNEHEAEPFAVNVPPSPSSSLPESSVKAEPMPTVNDAAKPFVKQEQQSSISISSTSTSVSRVTATTAPETSADPHTTDLVTPSKIHPSQSQHDDSSPAVNPSAKKAKTTTKLTSSNLSLIFPQRTRRGT